MSHISFKIIILSFLIASCVSGNVQSPPSGSEQKNFLSFNSVSTNISSSPDFNYIPDMVYISVDTLRADRLGCYGYPRHTSPELDRLSRSCVQMANAISQAPWTLPSYISLFSGLTPAVHRVDQETSRIPDHLTTLPEILKQNGYVTSGIVSSLYLSKRFNFHPGFGFFDDSQALNANKTITSPAIADLATKWLRQNRQSPYFLFVHFIDPHHIYIPPRILKKMFLGKEDSTTQGDPKDCPREKFDELSDLYDGEIRNTDTYIGKIISLLKHDKTWDKMMLAFNADGRGIWRSWGDWSLILVPGDTSCSIYD